MGIEWGFKDTELLRSMFKAGCKDEQIARVIGRTEMSVTKYRSENGLVYKSHGGGVRHYTNQEDALIRLSYMDGKNDIEIAAMLEDRTGDSVRNRRIKLNIGIFEKAEKSSRGVQAIKDGNGRCAPGDGEEAHKAATLMHLLDLKRAGHSPRATELAVPSEGLEQMRSFYRAADDRSYCGSSSAMCEGA